MTDPVLPTEHRPHPSTTRAPEAGPRRGDHKAAGTGAGTWPPEPPQEQDTPPGAGRPAVSSPAVSSPTPSDVDALLRDPAALPHLTAAQRRDLCRLAVERLVACEPGTPGYSTLRARVVELHLPLVRHLAAAYIRNPDIAEDVLQVGVIGLIKAIDRYEPRPGGTFAAFAVPTVLGEIKRFFRDTTWPLRVPRRVSDLRAPLIRARDDLTTALGRPPTRAELAAELGVAEDLLRQVETMSRAYTTLSLDGGTADGRTPGRGPLLDLLGDGDPRLELIEHRHTLAKLIAALPPREREILALRFTGDMTQKQIGERLGVSQVHVSRLLARTLHHLRRQLADDPSATSPAPTGARSGSVPAPRRARDRPRPGGRSGRAVHAGTAAS